MMSLRDDMLAGGRPPPTPGIYRFPGQNGCRQMLAELRALDRRSVYLELVSEIGSGGQDDPC